MATATQLTSDLPPAIGSRKFLSTRRGTIVLAALAGLGALGVLLVFMSNYRQSVATTADVRVLVADRFIDKGTSGAVIAEAELFRSLTVTEDEVLEGAVTDLSAVTGQVLTKPLYRGQQLTAAYFAPGADPIAGKLEGTQRAISVPVSETRGNVGQVAAGARVDVLGSMSATTSGGRARPIVDALARDILVLSVPEISGSTKAVVLRVTDAEASRIAWGADAGEIWLTVRPPTLGTNSKPGELRQTGSAGVSLLGG